MVVAGDDRQVSEDSRPERGRRTVLDGHQVQTFAARLQRARERRTPILALTSEIPGITVDDGYQVQRAQITARVAAGERLAGWKVGLTSAATRVELGIHEPVAGPVFASTIYPSGVAIDAARLIAPAVEAEIAFLMRSRLAGPGVTLGGAALAVEGAMAALEVVDCRYRDWQFKTPDLTADCSMAAGLVVGSRLSPLGDLDLALEGLCWEQDGLLIATATGAEVGGTPLTSVVWLANKVAEWGLALEPGDVVSAGSLTKVLRPRSGQSVRATFTRLGSVSLRFV